MYGYHGCYLSVELSTGAARRVEIGEGDLRRFLGGVGLGTFLLHREAAAGIDPFDPRAPVVFALSPLVGTSLTTSAKFAVVAKSPLTLRLNDALASSGFAIQAKRAGLDALVIKGRCPQWSVLVIDEGRVRIREAGGLLGLSAAAAAEELAEQLGPDYAAACIGPGGERLVRFATLSYDGRHAGRGGIGAVLGSKRLKGVAVRGTQAVAVADPEAVVAASQDLSRRSFGPATAKYRELGTASNLLILNRAGALPTRNFQEGSFEQAESIGSEVLADGRRMAKRSCASCTIGCEHIYHVGGRVKETTRAEYQSIYALGPLCGVADPEAVLRACKRCDELGLDTISTGGTLAFAMECAQRGLIDRAKLRFGSAEAMLGLIEDIGHRRGLGDLLAEGCHLASKRIGRGAEQYALHVKGMEIPGYEPRRLPTMALGLAVGTRGADHNRSGGYQADLAAAGDPVRNPSGTASLAVMTEDAAAIMDSLILCKFLRGVFEDFYAEAADLLAAVTGWDVSSDELGVTARRIVTARKLFNIREGWTRAEDTLPARLLNERLADGACLTAEVLEGMVRAYYARRGWTAEGLVPDTAIGELGLQDLAARACEMCGVDAVGVVE